MSAAKILEIACFDLDSAIIAEQSGADRIEFCIDYKSGGISPSVELLLKVREKIKIPLHSMVRPRAGNFIYSETEVQWMIQYIKVCEQNGIDGVVFGALLHEDSIDIKTTVRLTGAAGAMSLTFHRAIDECTDMEHSMRELIDLGIQRVLTSGGQKDALSGLEQIKRLQLIFGEKIVVMPGGSIRSGNIEKIKESGCYEFHSSALKIDSLVTDPKEVRALKQLLT